MGRLIVRRLLGAIPLLIIISFMAFALVLMMPGDPAITIAGDGASEQRIEEIRESLGENDPVVERYLAWASAAVTGDFGESIITGQPVRSSK